jgi:hypothetical protein
MLGQAEVVNSLEKMNETVPANAAMFTHNLDMRRGYHDSIPDVLGKRASSHRTCKLPPTGHLRNSVLCAKYELCKFSYSEALACRKWYFWSLDEYDS